MTLFNNLAYTWYDKNTFLMTADGGTDPDGDTYTYAFECHVDENNRFVFERVYEHDHVDATGDFSDKQIREIKAYMKKNMYARFPNMRPPLTGKYAKLRDDLLAVYAETEYLENTEDGGTCNFDAPTLDLPRWNADKIKQAAKEAGGSAFKWTWGTVTMGWVFSPRSSGQANRRTRRAEAISAALKRRGYNAGMYCAMD